MPSDIDQTTLTAYALGELDPAERQSVEAFLRDSAVGRGYVETIRRTGGLLSQELEREAVNGLTAVQRAALEGRIEQASDREPAAQRTHRRWNRAVLAGSIAASTLIVGTLSVLLYSKIYREMASTHNDAASVNAPYIISLPLPPGPQDGGEMPRSPATSPRFVSGAPGSGNVQGATPGVATHVNPPRPWFDAYPKSGSPIERIAGGGVLPPVDPDVYDRFADNPFRAADEPGPTGFAADVGAASYMNVRRALARGELPPRDAVRVEEMLTYFAWQSPPPEPNRAISGDIELSECPWNKQHQLARILLSTLKIAPEQRPPLNLVFLIDVSPSMAADNRLPLMQRTLASLLPQLQARDRIAIVVSQSQTVILPPTLGEDRKVIIKAIDSLHAGGSVARGGGLDAAYAAAAANFAPMGINRVVLVTDGHWLDGAADPEALSRTIERGAAARVPLSVLAMSPTHLDDIALRHLANAGKGTLSAIDTITDAEKALIQFIDGSLVQTAQDIRIDVKVNPAAVVSYRLLGYESHAPVSADPDETTSNAIGAGHSVTALYELVPAGDAKGSALSVGVRYNRPGESKSDSLSIAAPPTARPLAQASGDFHFASAVAEVSMLLRASDGAGDSSFANAIALAEDGKASDEDGRRAEFVGMIRKARLVSGAKGK
jgi:Ca-activated chloride channel family protein